MRGGGWEGGRGTYHLKLKIKSSIVNRVMRECLQAISVEGKIANSQASIVTVLFGQQGLRIRFLSHRSQELLIDVFLE